jgi:TPR repeat protein
MNTKANLKILPVLLAFAGLMSNAAAQPGGLKFEPLKLDYARHCKKETPVKLERNWQSWNGEKVSAPSLRLVELAEAYASGTGGLPKDTATAKRILDHLKSGRRYKDLRTILVSARIAFDERTDRAATVDAFNELQQEFERGNTSVVYLLGQAYESGLGVGANKEKALEFYKLAATLGNTNAMIRTASTLKALGTDPEGQVVASVNALTNLVSAVESGDCSAANSLYSVYLSGELGVKDPQLAVRWYDVFAQSGSVRAAMRLGTLYRRGQIVDPDLTKALGYYEQAAAGGDARGAFEAGRAFAVGLGVAQDAKRATRYLEQAGEGGVDSAWPELVRLYSPEINANADLTARFRYLERGIKSAKPDTHILVEYAKALLEGTGTERNAEASMSSLQKAVDAGSADAAWLLGKLYFYGHGDASPDTQSGLKLIRFAATSGEQEAASLLSKLYRCGANVERSSEKADLWQQRAAFFGSGVAMRDLAAHEAERDPFRAQMYLRQAARRGSAKALAQLGESYRLGTWLSPDQELAERWENYASANGEHQLAGELLLIRATAAKNAGKYEEALALLSRSEDLDQGRIDFERARVLRAMSGAGAQSDVISALKQAVAKGNAPAMWELSLISKESGASVLGHDRDYWLLAAAQAGHAKALIAVAENSGDARGLDEIFSAGKACSATNLTSLAKASLAVEGEKGRVKALGYIAAAEAVLDPSDSSGLASVGEALISMGGDESARLRGQALLEKAAGSGDLDAMRRLGIAMAGTADDTAGRDKALEYLLPSIKPGDDRPIRAVLEILRGASAGNVVKVFAKLDAIAPMLSFSVLKRVNELTLGDDKVSEMGSALMNRASESGNPAALVIMADRKFSGFRTQQDIPGGIALLKKAAETGDAEAVKALAAAYDAGFGVARNEARARELRESVRTPMKGLLQ